MPSPPSTSSSSAVVQKQPARNVTETTALLKSPTSSSLSSSIHSTGSLSELSLLSQVSTFQISRHHKRICCNFTREYLVQDPSSRRDDDDESTLFVATQENGCCSSEFEDMFIYDLQDQLMFSIEYDGSQGFFSTQMKFSVVSSTKIGIGTVSRIWSFLDPPRYDILNWDGSHLFSIGPPKTSGIRSYDYTRKYSVISRDGRTVAKLIHQGRTVSITFDSTEHFQFRDKTLILSLGFIVDLLRNDDG